jgi:hypothetical protein
LFVAAGDFNGDGKTNLVLVDYFDTDNSVLVMQGNGNGTFGKPLAIKFTAQLGFEARVVGDFFGDGKASVAVTTGTGNVTLLRGNGDGTFQAPASFLADFNGPFPNALAVSDFNGDGKPDLAVTNFQANDVSVLLNTSPPPSHANPVATATSLTADNRGPQRTGQSPGDAVDHGEALSASVVRRHRPLHGQHFGGPRRHRQQGRHHDHGLRAHLLHRLGGDPQRHRCPRPPGVRCTDRHDHLLRRQHGGGDGAVG